MAVNSSHCRSVEFKVPHEWKIIIPIMRAITRVIITQFTNVFIAKYCIVHSHHQSPLASVKRVSK